MTAIALPAREAKTRRISGSKVGIALTVIPVLFLAFDAAVKFTNVAPVADSMNQLGWPISLTSTIAITELVCLALYLIPRTSVLGVVLLTGYLGGAVATHVRVENPLFSHVLFPVYVAALLWGGLYLRDARVRGLV